MAIDFLKLCFNVIFEFITDCLVPGQGFFYLVVYTYVVYTCIVCPAWSFMHISDDHHLSKLRGSK